MMAFQTHACTASLTSGEDFLYRCTIREVATGKVVSMVEADVPADAKGFAHREAVRRLRSIFLMP